MSERAVYYAGSYQRPKVQSLALVDRILERQKRGLTLREIAAHEGITREVANHIMTLWLNGGVRCSPSRCKGKVARLDRYGRERIRVCGEPCLAGRSVCAKHDSEACA